MLNCQQVNFSWFSHFYAAFPTSCSRWQSPSKNFAVIFAEGKLITLLSLLDSHV